MSNPLSGRYAPTVAPTGATSLGAALSGLAQGAQASLAIGKKKKQAGGKRPPASTRRRAKRKMALSAKAVTERIPLGPAKRFGKPTSFKTGPSASQAPRSADLPSPYVPRLASPSYY